MRLYYFNPETEMALAAGSGVYTPPRNIAEAKNRLGLLPVVYAEPGSAVLVDSGAEVYPLFAGLMRRKQIVAFSEQDIIRKSSRDFIPTPWGWNESVLGYFNRLGFDQSRLPCYDYMGKIRQLAHRRTTISFHGRVRDMIGDYGIVMPEELNSIDDVRKAVGSVEYSVLKAPLSSSGKGIVTVAYMTTPVESWIASVIRRQGSVMWEKKEMVALDFASEWEILSGAPVFRGLSVFETAEGRYNGNLIDSQNVLKRRIGNNVDKFINVQYDVLAELIAPYYSGPLGIDMFITEDGRINPCVEINLRTTMGHASIALFDTLRLQGIFKPWIPEFVTEI